MPYRTSAKEKEKMDKYDKWDWVWKAGIVGAVCLVVGMNLGCWISVEHAEPSPEELARVELTVQQDEELCARTTRDYIGIYSCEWSTWVHPLPSGIRECHCGTESGADRWVRENRSPAWMGEE